MLTILCSRTTISEKILENIFSFVGFFLYKLETKTNKQTVVINITR